MSRGSPGLPRALRIVLDVATSLRMSAGAMLLGTGSQSVIVHRRPYCTSDGHHGVIQLNVDETGMCRVPPNWSTVLSHIIAECQC